MTPRRELTEKARSRASHGSVTRCVDGPGSRYVLQHR
jgi:hypothetical protein